jgi:hypothetical protein
MIEGAIRVHCAAPWSLVALVGYGKGEVAGVGSPSGSPERLTQAGPRSPAAAADYGIRSAAWC